MSTGSERSRAVRRWAFASILVALTVVMTACGGGDGGEGEKGDTKQIEFWTVLGTSDRAGLQRKIDDAFTRKTGIKVKLVQLETAQLVQTMVSRAAAGDLPDVVFHPVDQTPGWVREGVLDADAATDVVNRLGKDSFNERALQLVEGSGKYGAVPSDGWGQMLFYRKDLFEQAGLAVPDTFDKIEQAAKTLHGKGDTIGIVAGSKPGERFTMQTFENMALANDCQLVDDQSNPALDSPNCANTIAWYSNLMKNYSAGGEQDVDSTRSTYLAGKAAMVSWSPHLLDELAGLFPDTPPTCPKCEDDPEWLAQRTGIVPLIQGPDASEPAQFGQTFNLGITTGASTDAAKQFVEYLLGEAYLDFLAIAPEGRFPMREGTAESPSEFVDGWAKLPVGVGTTKPIGELYGGDVADALSQGATGFDRWGFPQGRGPLETAVFGDLSLTRDLWNAIQGAPAEQVAAEMNAGVEQLAGQVDG